VSGRKIAFFDFDGTITTKDTLLELIKFQKGKTAFYFGFVLHAPWLIAYKLKLFPNDDVKQKMLKFFFGDMPETIFQSNCDLFAKNKLPALIRPGAITEIAELKARGFEIVVVSASAENWLRSWTGQLGLQLIATRLEVLNGLMTGRIEGKNCHGEQKVIRIKQQWNLSEFEEIYGYGDSSGDKPMLALATRSFYKPFRTA
jgi:phosphatidylglycerophosphatase C